MAGVPGFEPGLSVLETDVLTVDTIPLQVLPIADFRLSICARRSLQLAIGNRNRQMVLLRFLVTSVLAATTAEFAELQPVRRCLLVFSRNVVATLTIGTLKHNIVAWHILFPISDFRLPINCRWPNSQLVRVPFQSAIGTWQSTMLLFNHFRNGAGSDRAAAFTNREA